jgi:hypothetical protein
MKLVICRSITRINYAARKSLNSLSKLLKLRFIAPRRRQNCCEFILHVSLTAKQMCRARMNANSAAGILNRVHNAKQSRLFLFNNLHFYCQCSERIFAFSTLNRSSNRIQLSYEFNCCAFPSITENLSPNFSGDLCSEDSRQCSCTSRLYGLPTHLTLFHVFPPQWN